ncbi:General substrate transporter [Cynara cardunculus var. scolymus]|uniref:General substrate transporter n=1 Tax=Cynara cardunculus var. scolymus TaxID=59895 RepID=A0A118K1F5_CYNCS|nr:General substrate transporter [Cynara cardunculus var. scolymus]
MQAINLGIKGSVIQSNIGRVDPGLGQFGNRAITVCMSRSERRSCFGLRSGSGPTGLELGRVGLGSGSMFRSSAKSRSVKSPDSDGDIEEDAPLKSPSRSSGSVLPYVGVASLGAILFGYHLGILVLRKMLFFKDGLLAHFLLVPLLVRLQGDHWQIILEGKKLLYWMQSRLQLEHFFAKNVETMILGRLFCGIGIGISSAIVPLYISELFICIGILAALVAGLPLAGNHIWWRVMFGIAVIPSVLLALGMAFSPESPRWLVQQRKISQAEQAIKKLYGKDRVTELIEDLNSSSQGSEEQEAGWFDLFSSLVSVGASLFLFQQLAGINAVVYYSTSVFRSAGVASDVAASALVGAANVLAPYSGPLAVIGTVLYVLSFSLGAGPVPALLLPEIFASRIRAKAVALSLGMHWITNFFIGLCFLSIVTTIGISKVYLGFAIICLLAVIYIAAKVVETKGRSLEDIERELSPAI